MLRSNAPPAPSPQPQTAEAYIRTPKVKQKRPTTQTIQADAKKLPIKDGTVDVVITSPPYWRKRDYGFAGQIGQENTPAEFIASLIAAMDEWRRVLADHGSVFINIGDTYYNRMLAGIPGRLESAACDNGWILRNRIVWTKDRGMPDPATNRLVNRHEYIMHFAKSHDYYYDSFGYSAQYSNGTNPGDVWSIPLRRNVGGHLAPYPEELVERIIHLATPELVCPVCGVPRRRLVGRTAELDMARPQARRALELAKQHGLTPEHIAAVQATGISDAGKALKVQNGTGRNTEKVKLLANEAKKVLGGYFREFTFAKRETVGWTDCGCAQTFRPGVVLDPFMGTGTTLKVAARLGRSSIGVDLAPKSDSHVWGNAWQEPTSSPSKKSKAVGSR